MTKPLLDSPQINSGPKTTSSERRTELVPEVVFVELCAFCNRLQTVEKVELRIASSSRKHEAASLVRLRRPSTRHRTRSQKSSRRRRARADERIVTLAWFTRNRFFPLREGSMWKEATAETHKSAIERDILATFGDLPLAEIDKVMLQTQVKALRSGCRMVGKALPLLLEGDLRRGHRAGVRDEKSGTQAGPAKASPSGGQDYSELASVAARTGVGSAQGSHPADAGHVGRTYAHRKADCLQGRAARLRARPRNR